ncbi:MAG TPA: glycerate kinase [Kiritimatiellia bacterium]|jgi:glycerate kinase
MKIVIAMDSLKGSLDARSACEAAARGIRSALPGTDIVIKPMADGGEGTADAFRSAWGGTWIPLRATGPLPGRDVDAGYAWFEDRHCSVVEMAAASGITLLARNDLNPLRTTTFGTGQLLKDAFARGAPVRLAVGGSATVDGGVGAAMALGWKFLDANGKSVGLGGGELARITSIAPPEAGSFPPVEVLCDTTVPLCGERGAAPTFGPQKGATPDMVRQLGDGLANLAARVRSTLGLDIATLPGGGAAGGLAAGAVAFFRARIVSGVEAVIKATGLAESLAGADWVVTGEGCFDATSLGGKVVSGVIGTARGTGARVAVLAGSVRLAEAEWRAAGVSAAASLKTDAMSVEHAMAHTRELLEARAGDLFQRPG